MDHPHAKNIGPHWTIWDLRSLKKLFYPRRFWSISQICWQRPLQDVIVQTFRWTFGWKICFSIWTKILKQNFKLGWSEAKWWRRLKFCDNQSFSRSFAQCVTPTHQVDTAESAGDADAPKAADWCSNKVNQVFFCQSVHPEFLRKFLVKNFR